MGRHHLFPLHRHRQSAGYRLIFLSLLNGHLAIGRMPSPYLSGFNTALFVAIWNTSYITNTPFFNIAYYCLPAI